jgi:hypothetical protein
MPESAAFHLIDSKSSQSQIHHFGRSVEAIGHGVEVPLAGRASALVIEIERYRASLCVSPVDGLFD